MDLKFDLSIAEGYKSKSQIVRVLSENWVGRNAYCPSCGYHKLSDFENNSPVADFFCTDCNAEYELKSKKDTFSLKIVDGAFKTMIKRINAQNNPHFFLLNYSSLTLEVKNFLVIPKHYFIDDIIEKRKPLGLNAKRAGWVGCNILLKNIPEFGKIFYIKNGLVKQPKKVIEDWSKTAFLATQRVENRGWTIEIMKIIDKIPNKNFSLNEVYYFEADLKRKFPKNNFVKDKIRQQLQVLRDRGLIKFKSNGSYAKVQPI